MGIYKRGEVWWARASHKGVEHRDTLETASRAVAEDRFQEWHRRLKASNWGEKQRRTFRETAMRFTGDYFPRLKPSSRERYRVSLMSLADHFDGKFLDEISSAGMADFEAARRREKVSDGTIRRDLSCLSSIFSRAEEWEYFHGNPAAAYLRRGVKRGLKEASPRKRYLSLGEERTILENIGGRGSEMFYAAVAFAIDTGLRSEEQFSLTWRDIDLERSEVVVSDEKAKSGVGRRVPILPRAADLLRTLPRHGSSTYVFWHRDGKRYLSMYQQLVRLARKLEMGDLRWHDLRRTCGCRLIQDYNLPLEKVAAWLGHSSVSVTEKVYAFLDVRHLHAALKIVAQSAAQLRIIEGAKLLEKPYNKGDLDNSEEEK